MKALFATAFALLVWNAAQAQFTILAEQTGQLTLNFSVDNFIVSHDGIYTDVTFQESNPVLVVGAPAVCERSTSIIVDDISEMAITVDHAIYQEYQDVYMRPSKGNLLRTVDPVSIPFQEGPHYSFNEFYPGKLASLGSPYIQHQFRGQSIHFYPVQYNPVTHTLRLYSSIDVTVSETGTPGFNPLPAHVSQRTSLPMQEVYKSHFLNYTSQSSRYDQVGELGNMLVISHSQYMDELQPWVQWKKEKGIPVEVVDVAQLNSVSAITQFVQNYYETNGLTYLVLVGDEDQVPVQLVNYSSGQGYCDACYGYTAGNDSYADLFVGHFLVHNDSELPALLQKTLEYERNPNTAIDWFSVAMGIGSNEGDGIGDDNEADWQHQNGIKEDLLSFTYSQVWEKYDGGHTANSPSGGLTADESGSPSSSSLTEVIEGGCSLINYTGHGAHTLIVTGSYTNTQINQLQNNGRYPYFIVVGCCTGDYDDDDDTGDTFGEAWIKSPSATNLTGGIGGAFSSVYQSWAPPMEAQDEMNKIIANTAGINTRHTIGSIHYHGCSSMSDSYGVDGDEMTDTWILMADPSVQLRTAMPSALVASHATGISMGVSSLVVFCATEGAIVCASMNGEILDAQPVSGGQVVLSFDPIGSPGNILITATSFNTIPYQGTIAVTPAEGPYVVSSVASMNDASGNANGLADYNEQIGINLWAENIGVENAEGVTATITCNNISIVIDDANQELGMLVAGSQTEFSNAFSFHVNGFIADQTEVLFEVVYVDENGNTWTSYFSVIIQAPQFECMALWQIDDSQGNNNGRLDAGETVQVTAPISNSGHSATNVVVQLNSVSAGIIISNTTLDFGLMQPGQSEMATFDVSLAADVSGSVAINLMLAIEAGLYGVPCEQVIIANQSMEDWESGSDENYNWVSSGDADWFVTASYSYEGDHSMQSGDIGNNDVTNLELAVNCPAQFNLTFAVKTSTEADYDFLTFFVDGVEVDSWSGENDWTEVGYTLSSGTHTLRWSYEKDFIVTSGMDACWIDNIVLPGSASVEVENSTSVDYKMQVYPNPVDRVFILSIQSLQSKTIQVRVLNSMGSLVVENSKQLVQGENIINIESEHWAPGIYTLQIGSGDAMETLKVVRN
jgi:hypothetical protein